MKRYTGQQALYEAISRSRAKAKQGSILERLRPESEKPKTQESGPSPEPEDAVEQAPSPVVQEPNEAQAVETPVQPEVEQESTTPPVAETAPEPVAEATTEPVERPAPVLKPRPVERLLHPASSKPVQAWLRPRPVQLNEGRIEVSVPYYVGGIVGLAAIVVVLAAFRLGQARSGGQPVQPAENRAGVAANSPTQPVRQDTPTNTSRPQPRPSTSIVTGQDTAPAASQGDNWIVLAQHKRREDLVPVVEYFANHGIELFILPLEQAPALFAEYGLNASRLPQGTGYLLLTVKAFNNPNDPATDGFTMKQKITEVGAQYKAPSGFERFAPNYFSDAYGMKIR